MIIIMIIITIIIPDASLLGAPIFLGTLQDAALN